MDICIVGSGISGLSAAHELSRQPGLSVTVLERDSEFGGRANVTADGEHCPRFFLPDYTQLYQLLREIPLGDATVYDALAPARRFAQTVAGEWVEISHLYASRARELSRRDRRAISKENRKSLLIAKQGRTNTNRFGYAANYSPRAMVRMFQSFHATKLAYVFPGGMDRYVIEPWIAYLRARGVIIEAGSQADLVLANSDSVEVLVQGVRRRFDAVLVTAFAPDAYSLLDRAGVARPLDCRQHTHCKCFTVDLDQREPILTDPDVRVYSNCGITTIMQPAERRCIALCTVSRSTAETFVIDRLTEDLRLRHPPVRVRSRDNLAPGEAVFVGDYVDPTILEGIVGRGAYFAGSSMANSYPVDSAEGACRSAYCALERMAAAHPEIEPPRSAAAVPRPSATQRPRSHPNMVTNTRALTFLWRACCIASAVSGAAVSRMSFVDLSETEWPLGAPAIYVANHRSIFDVVAGIRTFDHLGVRPRLIVAERFFRGTAGRALTAVGALPALRGSDATISAAVAAIEAGESVAFMVEGKLTTRADSRDAAHGRGAPTVAALTGVPVVPLGSWGTDRPWPRPKPWPVVRLRRPRIAVAIGPPIRHHESSPAELGPQIRVSLGELELIAGRHVGDPTAFVDDNSRSCRTSTVSTPGRDQDGRG